MIYKSCMRLSFNNMLLGDGMQKTSDNNRDQNSSPPGIFLRPLENGKKARMKLALPIT